MAAHAAKNPPELSNSEQFWQKVSRFQSKLSVKLHQNLIWWQKYYTFFKIKTLQISSFLRNSIIKSQKSLQKFFFKNIIFARISENRNFQGNVSFNFLVAHPPPGTYPRDCTRDGLWVPPAGLHSKMSRGEEGHEKNWRTHTMKISIFSNSFKNDIFEKSIFVGIFHVLP